MTIQSQPPAVRPGRLVTVAYLKAQLDAGGDHLGIFMPLILDVLHKTGTDSFTTSEVQELLVLHHDVVMPQQTVATLLGRATKKKYIIRAQGRYVRNPNQPLPSSEVSAAKQSIEHLQERLGTELQAYAAERGLSIPSVDNALELLLDFLEDAQVGMLLGTELARARTELGRKERATVAAFVDQALRSDASTTNALQSMLEGLVLYHAAFLSQPGLTARQFKDLSVLFDSTLVRQLLGYEGVAARVLMGETVSLLQAGGVRCLVLDKTVFEIKRILEMYERKFGTAEGRRSLRGYGMARHFLTQGYEPSDIREMSALLERDIVSAGLTVLSTPRRDHNTTAAEKLLSARLADPIKRDETEPRVVHDVDCVAAALTLRRGHRSGSIEDARAVFATASPLVIHNTRLWWVEDEHEDSIEPVVHIRALANVAWLKKPSMAGNFKLAELTALCAAALRPSQATWDRFLRHLDALQKSDRIDSDDTAAILISSMSDRLLRDAEVEAGDPNDIDAVTFNEVVRRVQESYVADEREKLEAVTRGYEGRVATLEARARKAEASAEGAFHSSAERARQYALAIDGRARRWTRAIAATLQWLAVAIIVVGGAVPVFSQRLPVGGWGLLAYVAVLAFIMLEVVGALSHLSQMRRKTEARLYRTLRSWLRGPTGEPSLPAG